MSDTILPEVLSYYNDGHEAARLTPRGMGEWEKLRTQDILHRFLPPAPATIYDVGGGAGVHALPLAEAGYRVTLLDPVPLHVAQAKEAAGGRLADAVEGDARALPWPDRSADAVLLLGPLYHLTDRHERLVAIREAWRVLKPNGVLFAAAISRFASTVDGLSRGLIRDPKFTTILAEDLRSGQHRNDTGDARYFTTAFFHRPQDLAAELAVGGFTLTGILGIEGPVWNVQDHLADAGLRETVLATARAIEAEPSIAGASAHLMGIGRKP